MKLKDCVEIKAFDHQGHLICHQIISRIDWYDGLHPIIDQEQERAHLHIRRVDGVFIDQQGEIEKSWRNFYSEDGVLLRFDQWQGQDAPFYSETGEDQLCLEMGE